LKRKTIYAFIDSQNLNLSVLNDVRNKKGKLIYKGWQLDFQRFYVYLKNKYKANKVFLFIGYIPKKESLYEYLQKSGYTLIFKPTLEYKKNKKKFIKGNVDAELILNAMIEYPKYSKAIIVAGDGDYHCLIEYLEKNKKLLYVIIPNAFSYSSLLKEFRKYFIYINNLKSKLEAKTKTKKRGSNLRTKP
jgi:uncharacterized LabA/DUF88 family protein